jgi:thioesterase domain-containing protein/acyl carrier protein
VLYTSGSTGRPKGVRVLNKGVANLLQFMQLELEIRRQDILLAVTTLSFDIAALELFLPLVTGARVVIASREVATDGLRLLSALEESEATFMQATPATWRMLVEGGLRPQTALKTVLSGGEALPRPLAESLLQRGLTVWNLYGPTETTIYSTSFRVASGQGRISIGRPIANTEVYILDESRRPVAQGELGELCIGGIGVASGYLNRPDLTAERFIPNPFGDEPGARLYRTGDLARFLPDGNLEYLGRADHQVKVRGHRIELGEIESRLLLHPSVRAAVVVPREDSYGELRLIAYLVAGDNDPSVEDLCSFLKQALPQYMVPATFVLVDELPLTPSGKIDRKALPAPENARIVTTRAFSPPRTPVELRLKQLWEELLEVRPIGVTDNFFHLGGDSVVATRMFVRIEELFGKRFPVSELVDRETIEELANLLTSDSQSQPSLLRINAHGSRPKLFLVPGVTGSALDYSELGKALPPEQPLFAFNSPSLWDAGTSQTTVEAMAAHYIRTMLAVQPHGPFHVGGWSFGAIVAFEMAQQLRAQGHEVALLAIVDEWSPAPPSGLRGFLTPSSFLIMKLGTLWRKSRKYSSWLQRAPWLFFSMLSAVLRTNLRPPTAMEREDQLAIGYGIDRMPPQYISTFRTNVRALVHYTPKVYPGHISLVRVNDHLFIQWRGTSMGWNALAAEGVSTTVIPGDHNLIIRPPQVQRLADSLRDLVVAHTR